MSTCTRCPNEHGIMTNGLCSQCDTLSHVDDDDLVAELGRRVKDKGYVDRDLTHWVEPNADLIIRLRVNLMDSSEVAPHCNCWDKEMRALYVEAIHHHADCAWAQWKIARNPRPITPDPGKRQT